MEELLLANALIGLLEQTFAKIEQLRLRGEITAEQQQVARDRYLALRAQGPAAFKPE